VSPNQSPLGLSSARIKQARRLLRRSRRRESGLFLAEGTHAVAAALAQPHRVVDVFASVSFDAPELRAAAGDRWVVVQDTAVAALSEAVSPQGVVAVCRHVHMPLDLLLTSTAGRLLVIAADIRDPGNAGGILRTADAAGADGVIFAGNAVDPYNAKAVRASVGSLFNVPVAFAPDAAAAVIAVRHAGIGVLAADGAGDADLFESDDVLAGPVAWLFGNEAHGLPESLADLADYRVRIPQRGWVESLNLAAAAAVCLFASARAHSHLDRADLSETQRPRL
jgi:RNA methyltransferase, TrmH family